MTRQAFYDEVAVKLFKGSLPAWQQQPLDQIMAEAKRRGGRSIYDVAYTMATAHHETSRFKYDEEIGEGSGDVYGQPVYLYRKKTVSFHGRSWPQHTWLGNYAKLSVRATLAFQRHIDFVNNPDMIKDDPVMEGWAMWEGMITGFWTGKNLADYTDAAGVLDYVEARRIVNGTDKADLIAGYAREYEAGLRLIEDEPQEVMGCPMKNAACPLNA